MKKTIIGMAFAAVLIFASFYNAKADVTYSFKLKRNFWSMNVNGHMNVGCSASTDYKCTVNITFSDNGVLTGISLGAFAIPITPYQNVPNPQDVANMVEADLSTPIGIEVE